ncbi:MAG TPA: hypothetical protein VEZ55_04880, partial [Chitinophagaceae bacterium]|nr:hypothetical protein [Chitinophagaceae bacterium]
MVRTFFIFLCLLLFTSSCKQRKHIGQKIIVQAPAEINKSATEIIQDALADFLEGNTPNGDFTNTSNIRQVKKLYSNRSFLPIWSSNGQWTEPGDSLFSLLESSLQFGLFPQDYH